MLEDLNEKTNSLFKLAKSMKKAAKDVEGGRCMRGRDGRLTFSAKDRGRIWKEHMEKITDKENEGDPVTDADIVKGLIKSVTREKVLSAMRKMKPRKAARPLNVRTVMITVSGELGIEVMIKLCKCVLDGEGMPEEWKITMVVPISNGKGDVMSCGK
eukprot:gene15455-6704_t